VLKLRDECDWDQLMYNFRTTILRLCCDCAKTARLLQLGETTATGNDYCTTSRRLCCDYVAIVLKLRDDCDWDQLLYNFCTTILQLCCDCAKTTG
jgi:hypothetical protein